MSSNEDCYQIYITKKSISLSYLCLNDSYVLETKFGLTIRVHYALKNKRSIFLLSRTNYSLWWVLLVLNGSLYRWYKICTLMSPRSFWVYLEV